ncbi:hypothetical protein Ccrd_020246, partial [Cynara cardunculus var. scolymus]
MADFRGFPVNQHQRRVRKKSERIMMKTYFSNFKNTIDNPIDVDAEAELERTNAVPSNAQGSSKGKEAEVERTNGVPRPAQGSSKDKVLEILNTQEPTEAEVERTNGVPRPAQGSSKGKDLKVTKPIVQQTSKQAARVGKVPERSGNQVYKVPLPQALDPEMVSGDNVRNQVKSPNEIMHAPRKECIKMMGERIADLRSSRTETDMLLQAYVE